MAAKEEPENGRRQAIDLALSQIEKNYGKGAILRLGSQEGMEIPVIPTGSLGLDIALGVGGVPRGRVVEIFGPESSGKTTLALHVVANAQRDSGIAAFIDTEHALDPSYAKKLGVNLDDLLVSQPDTGEQALEITELLVSSNAVDVIVLDSVAALVPRAEIEGQMGDAHMGLQARLMSQALRKLTGAINKSRAVVIFTNQIRQKIGVMFGNPETTPGGLALKFYASVRIDIRRIGAIKNGEEVIGNRTRAKVVKNKVAAPFREAEFDILFGSGVSLAGEIIDLGIESEVIKKIGTWLSYGETRLGQGREKAREFLLENADLQQEIRKGIVSRRTARSAGAG
ncbi:MAG: recombinase RecA [Planctomycetes bacterium]|nr:recombinase RecA [Planctomycetota bacterium]